MLAPKQQPQLVDPTITATQPDYSKMGFSPQEQQALNNAVDPAAVVSEFRQQSAREDLAIEGYELQRMREENDALRADLGQSREQVNQVQQQHANLAGQVQQMQQNQLAASQQAQLDQQYAIDQDLMDAHGEVLPLVEKVVGRTTAKLQSDYDLRLQQELARSQQETAAPLMTEIESLKRQNEAIQQQTANQNAARLSAKIQDLGLGSIDQLLQNPEFLQKHASPVYPGSTTQWGQELTRHIKEGNVASAETMLEDFQQNSQTFKPREDVQVPTGRTPAPVQTMTTERAQNLAKRDDLVAIYEQRMEDANNGNLPHGQTRAQYKMGQEELRRQIDAIPTQ